MSTIDMTQVAGLQAVNAEGNVIGTLSVNDLTELVANNLVKSTQNQIAAARSVSTMSEASTLAASDEYENTLPIDANPASVRTLDSAGNPKQTGISALAQVVGELNEINKMVQFTDEQVSDCNDCKPQRIYLLSNKTNKPVFMTTHLLVCIGGDYLKCQIATDDTNVVGFRAFYNNEWTEWRAI